MTTDEVGSHHPKSGEQEEPVQDLRSLSEEEEQLQRQNRNSAGHRLSRLFSSFLKRHSQCDSEAGEKEKVEEAKAPIADPEPELKTRGEVAPDQRSLTSVEAQALQVWKKAAKEEEVEKDNEQEEKEWEDKEKERKKSSPEGGDRREEREKREDAKAVRAARRPKTIQIRVTLLDDTLFECELEKHAKGQELFRAVCDHLNLLEQDYYGLAIWETPTMKTWMDLTKEIRRQVQGAKYNFTFNVKFYPPDPAQLSEDITRYYLCLQLRKDILQGRLPCSFVTLALLGSYALQSELGEYDPELHGSDYSKVVKLTQGQSKELEDKMMVLHHTYRSMSPAQADLMFLENAKKLSMYGVDLHQAMDLDGVDIMLGVSSSGLMVYKDKLRINRFPWPKVLKVSYKHSNFFIKLRPTEVEQCESAIGFKLHNCKTAKKLWKVCVEHHAFFRLPSTEMATTPKKFLPLGSKFRYSGRTQAQTRQASSLIDRPAPLFQRSSSKRNSCSLDGDIGPTPDNRSARPVSDPVMTPASPGEMDSSPLLPMLSHTKHCGNSTHKAHPPVSADRKSDMNMGGQSTEATVLHSPTQQMTPKVKALVRRDRRRSPAVTTNGDKDKKNKRRVKKLEGETIYIRHSNLMLEDVEKTQTEIMRHHTSISELKKSFMESLPEPRPSEWDKRLSTNSPFRTATHLQPALGDSLAERDSGVLLSAQTITSETISTTTTTQITKTVKGGFSETRIEKRIVITGDTEIDHDKALAQAIKEAKEQHPDMSVTKVIVHQETEISPD
ncbi:protein 4.1 [Thalassophryne amazonica]|uniref:protein 4.1 n=1 Tax=Thalassophryne amazonica TaxID=390379 RepID=UPI001471339D|nr:protein 4.1 [Thalassophryne amazonica]